MAFIRSELKENAKNQLAEKWGTVIGAMVLMALVIGLGSGIFHLINMFGVKTGSGLAVAFGSLGSLVVAVITIPILFGWIQFCLNLMRNKEISLTMPFEGFRRFAPSVVLGILMYVFVFLWSLLLIIPGLIKFYSYSMSYYILADDENIAPIDAITKSREMMDGHKWEFFVLQLSFILWFFASVATCGIASFYLYPYMQITNANFYQQLKWDYEEDNGDLQAKASQAAEEVIAASRVSDPQGEVTVEDSIEEIDSAEEIDVTAENSQVENNKKED